MIIPSPFVYWAQTESAVSLKIDLKNVVEPDVKVLENNIKFSAQGVGARGESRYEFNLDLFSPVKTVSTFIIRELKYQIFNPIYQQIVTVLLGVKNFEPKNLYNFMN